MAVKLTKAKHTQLFIQLLTVAALLPRADKELSKRYSLSRRQIYLIYLVHNDNQQDPSPLSQYARWLNISNSTLTRNIEKLEERKILLREKFSGRHGSYLRLLSHGQLYALEIDQYMQKALGSINRKQLAALF